MTPEQYIEQLAHSLYTGTHTGAVDSYLVYRDAQLLMQHCYTGFDANFDTPGLTTNQFTMLQDMEHNIYQFATFKNHRFLSECRAMLEDSKGHKPSLDEYLKAVKGLNKIYHTYRSDVEADNVKVTAQAVKLWQDALLQKRKLPYLVWRTTGKDTRCPACGALNNTKLPVEHHFWNDHFVPAHYGCHCTIEQTNSKDDLTSDAKLPRPIYGGRRRIFKRNAGKNNGELIPLEHPYFDVESKIYNQLINEAEKIKPKHNQPNALGFIIYISPELEDVAKNTFDSLKSIIKWPAMPKTTMLAAYTKEEYGSFEYLNNQININPNGDHYEMTIAHELGHMLDYHGFSSGSWESENETSNKLTPLLNALTGSLAVRELTELSNKKYYIDKKGNRKYFDEKQEKLAKYYISKREIFARAFAQYIAYKSDNAEMIKQCKKIRTGIFKYKQWDEEDFKFITLQFDTLLKQQL
ncbi:MAG TPA: hypothetical protein VK154_14870 [Chitinophagales bacterium]|nr:hypothetical protein [Chitinophagales bacterium]